MSIFTTTSPTTGGLLPGGITPVGGIVFDLIGLNGARVTAQLSASSLFSGFAGSAIFTIGTQGGFSAALLAALGGGIAEAAVRITLSDGDTAPGNFDYNQNWLLLDGINVGSFTRPTEQTAADGTLISSGTGFGDGILSTGWWHITDASTLSSLFSALSDGSLSFQVQDADYGDNFYDFTQGVNGGLVNVGAPPNISPIVSGPVSQTSNEDAAGFTVDLLAGASDGDGDPLSVNGLTADSGDTSGITVTGTTLDVDPSAYNYLALGDSEVVVYSYTVEDGNGGSVAQTATITIEGRNDSPTVSAAVSAITSEDAAASSVDLLAYADDDDDGHVLGISGLTTTSGDDSGITLDGTELDIDPSAYNHLAAGESEFVEFSYNVVDEHGASTAQTATVTINGVNDGPTANDDTLGGAGGGVLNVGYYDMYAGQGVASQVAAILAAGHNPVLITELSAAALAGIDVLVVQNPDNFGYGSEYLAALADIEAAVSAGLELIIHDRHVDGAESILPGSAGFTILGYDSLGYPDAYGSDVEFLDDLHSVADGPGGLLDDLSLDGGNFSTHGYAIGGTLPSDADIIHTTGDASHVVTFTYGHGSGHVVYSSIPLDHYLSLIHAGYDFGSGIFDNADNYLTNLVDYTAVDLNSGPLTDEDTVLVIDEDELLANDTDPDDSDVLTITGVSALSNLGAAVALHGDGTISYDPRTALNSLSEGEEVEDSFTYTISDGNGGTDTATVTFTVVGVNDGPSAPVDIDPTGDSLTANATISEHLAVGSAVGIEADSTDPEDDPINYYFRDGSNAITQTLGHFTIDASTGVVTLATEVNYELATSHSITVFASDGSLESSTTFNVSVTNVVEHLFTPGNDGTAADPIDFNALPPGAYDYDGAQYDALSGDDFVILPDLATSLLPGHVWDYTRTFNASAGNDVVQGGDGNDIVSGGDGNDRLFGGDGDDRLVGSAGDDILGGGDGADKLTGSSGRDIFIFTDSEIGTTKLGEHDVITDFQQGTDKIDISALYDGGTYNGLKNGALTGGASNAYKVGYYSSGGKTWLEGDVNGDGVADWVIEMSGNYKLKGTDVVVGPSVIATEAAWNTATGGGLNWLQHHQDDFFA